MDIEKYQKLEVKTASEEDKIKDYLTGKTRYLSPKNKTKLENINKVYALLASGYSKSNTLKIIQKQDFFIIGKSISIRQAYKMYNACIHLYGDLANINKEAERMLSREKYLTLAKKLEDAGDYIGAGKMRENADKIIGLFEHTSDKQDFSIFMQNVKVQVTRTNNVQVLRKNQGQNDGGV